MTLVTAQAFLITDLCGVIEKYENNLQVCAYVHIVHCNRIFNSIRGKVFKQIKINQK